MTVHINKTKNVFVEKRTALLFKYKHYIVRMIMNRSYFDAEDYQEMRSIQHKLAPLSVDEQIDIEIEISQNKRFFHEDY